MERRKTELECLKTDPGWGKTENGLHRYLLVRSRKHSASENDEMWFSWYEAMCHIVLRYSASKSGKRHARRIIAYLRDINNEDYPWEYSSRDRKRVPNGAQFLNAVDDLFSLALSQGALAHAKRTGALPFPSLRVVEAAVKERLPVTSIMTASVLILGPGQQG
jgi:hypothetical protein